jgi:hypothetical protein
MGSALSPEAANFFMGVIESSCGLFKALLFDTLALNQGLRCYAKGTYIDDCFFVVAGLTEEALPKKQNLLQLEPGASPVDFNQATLGSSGSYERGFLG